MLTLLKRDGWPMLSIASLTVAVQLGLFMLAGAWEVPDRMRVPGVLIVAGVWTAIASGVFAAGPRSAMSGLLRGATVIDASIVLLAVLWLQTPIVTLVSSLKIYCIYAAVALCSILAARCALTARFRYLGAVCAGVLLTLLQAGLFWLPGILRLSPPEHKAYIAGVGLKLNPLYGVFSSIAAESGFVWHYAGIMYDITPLGEDIPVPPVEWWEPMAFYLIVAGILGVACAVVGRRRRKAAFLVEVGGQ